MLKYAELITKIYHIPSGPGAYSMLPASAISTSYNDFNPFQHLDEIRMPNVPIHAFYHSIEDLDMTRQRCVDDYLKSAANDPDLNFRITVLALHDTQMEALNLATNPEMHY